MQIRTTKKEFTNSIQGMYTKPIKSIKNIALNCFRIEFENGDHEVWFYDTRIISYINGVVKINAGNYRTHTTKKHINNFQSICRIFQKDYNWYVKLSNGSIVEFENDMIVI